MKNKHLKPKIRTLRLLFLDPLIKMNLCITRNRPLAFLFLSHLYFFVPFTPVFPSPLRYFSKKEIKGTISLEITDFKRAFISWLNFVHVSEKAEQQRHLMGNIAPNPELVKYCYTCKVDVPLRYSKIAPLQRLLVQLLSLFGVRDVCVAVGPSLSGDGRLFGSFQ